MFTDTLLCRTLDLHDFSARRGGRTLGAALNIQLLPGTVLGVVGPNGVGKSSLLAAIAGTGVSFSGSVRYSGSRLDRLSARRRSATLSLLPQDLAAPEELRVRELVSVGAHAGGCTDTRTAADRALRELGLSDLSDRRLGTLSGGQRQLVQLARVLAQDTPVVVLDEPTSALDLYHQRAVEQTMRRLGNDGKIVIAALHDLNLALGACTQMLLLDRDGAAHIGPPHEVLRPDLVHTAYGVHTTVHTTDHGRSVLIPHDH